MFNYPNSNVYVPFDEDDPTIVFCPKCGGKTEDAGECSQGCCDYRKCLNCGYRYEIEWPD
jgi:hypothetical protein